jgi:hypothetical protein
MIVIECSQGSVEWYQARVGIATASEFSNIITPKTMEFSKSADKYANKLVAEIMLKESLDMKAPTFWMERGTMLEADAGESYQFATGDSLLRAGFCLDDSRRYGCSLDRIVEGKSEGAEIKCPMAENHMGYLLNGKIEDDHRCQVQGQLLVTGYDAINCVSYYPGLPISIVRVGRDDKFIAALTGHLDRFFEMMNAKIEFLVKEGYMTLEVQS